MTPFGANDSTTSQTKHFSIMSLNVLPRIKIMGEVHESELFQSLITTFLK